MRRRWNWLVWVGFAVALFAAFSYVPLFTRFPGTRDVPWVNLLLFLAAGCLLGIGLYRAFAQPGKYRGKISGIALGALSLGLFGLFCFGVFYAARHLPSGRTALRVGQQAPGFFACGLCRGCFHIIRAGSGFRDRVPVLSHGPQVHCDGATHEFFGFLQTAPHRYAARQIRRVRSVPC